MDIKQVGPLFVPLFPDRIERQIARVVNRKISNCASGNAGTARSVLRHGRRHDYRCREAVFCDKGATCKVRGGFGR